MALDNDENRIAALRAGDSYTEDVTEAQLRAVSERITATTDVGLLADVDTIVFCVPTPLDAAREPDLGPLRSAAEAVATVLRAGQLVVLESTTYPGTTRELLAPILDEGSGLRAGVDFNLAFSPERMDPGRADHATRGTPKLVGGLTPECLARTVALYEQICDTVVPVSSPETAELAKLHENIFRSVNIAMVNEMAMLCERMGIDVWEVVDAAATKPYGFMRFDPGPGMGGHCLPVDPFYLSWRAKQFDMTTEFIESAGRVNRAMPAYCVERISRLLDGRVYGSRVGLVGVSYKGGVGDTRESPALRMIELLEEAGAIVSYHDPHVPNLPRHGLSSAPLETLRTQCDAIVIVTAHPGVDHDAIATSGLPVLDLRGVTRNADAPARVLL